MEEYFIEGVKFKRYDWQTGNEKVFDLIEQDYMMFPELVGFTQVLVWFKDWSWHVLPI